jgi:hypothetical protein
VVCRALQDPLSVHFTTVAFTTVDAPTLQVVSTQSALASRSLAELAADEDNPKHATATTAAMMPQPNVTLADTRD